MVECKICKSKTEKFTAFEKEYYKCCNCEFIFIDKQYILSKSEEADCYEYHNNTIENEGYVKMFEKFIDEAIDPFIKAPKDSLDFGSGPGPVLSELLKRKGFSGDIYDPYFSPEIPIGKKYDLITSTEVFEHFSNPLENMDLINTLLKDGGYLSIMTHYHYNSIDRFKTWWYPRDHTHISFYNYNTFKYIATLYNLDYVYDNKKHISVFRKKGV